MMEFNKAFNKANEKVHAVEDQWHYKYMTSAGYEPETREAKGFVRHYIYVHPETGRRFKLCTGASADYWVDQETGATGYWRELEPHLAKVA